MNILILQGPNLNLLGLKSAPTGDKLTLDKLNKALRKHVHRQETTLKFLQTHKQDKALNFLQRNRNWADGLLFIPTSWARYDWTMTETLELIALSTAVCILKSLMITEPLCQILSFREKISNHFPVYLLNLALRAWIIFYPSNKP